LCLQLLQLLLPLQQRQQLCAYTDYSRNHITSSDVVFTVAAAIFDHKLLQQRTTTTAVHMDAAAAAAAAVYLVMAVQ
jgi:hypothetical protein